MMRAPTRKAAARGISFSTNPVLAVQLPAWRSRVVLFFFFALFVVVGARAFWLQALSTDFLQEKGRSRYLHTVELPAVRGKITDRYGEVLASSLQVKTIGAIPKAFSASDEQLRELARLLEMPLPELQKKLGSPRSFVFLKRQVDDKVAARIAQLGIAGIDTRQEYKRFYPAGPIAAHILGFTNVEDVGQEGMELAQQSALEGVPGSRRVIRDRLGRIVEDIGYVHEPRDGRDLVLSIDNKIQYTAFAELQRAVEQHRAKAGAIVVLDVKTGEVLALANLPSYNPNTRQGLNGEQLRNRVMTDTYEPGSTLKPFPIALAMEQGLVTPRTPIYTPPKIQIGSAKIGDAHEHAPMMTVAEIIEKSSNVGTVRMAMRLEPRDMWGLYASVGFGQAPRFGFPGSVAGRMRPYKNWLPIDQATMSYGHGISVSLIQVARAYMVFARNGEIIPLSFQKLDEPPQGQRVISEKTARQMREMMERVAGPDGTAPLAQVRGYRVAGKTGTAHKAENGRYVNKYVASFVGLAPVSNPRIIIAVMVDEPSNGMHYGGQVAAPVFASVAASALRTMNVPPDASVENVIMPGKMVTESM